jgi:hypothetical protein
MRVMTQTTEFLEYITTSRNSQKPHIPTNKFEIKLKRGFSEEEIQMTDK